MPALVQSEHNGVFGGNFELCKIPTYDVKAELNRTIETVCGRALPSVRQGRRWIRTSGPPGGNARCVHGNNDIGFEEGVQHGDAGDLVQAAPQLGPHFSYADEDAAF